jgi:hypothetical protein
MKFTSSSTAIRQNSRSFTTSSRIIPFALRIRLRGKTFCALRKPTRSVYRKVIPHEESLLDTNPSTQFSLSLLLFVSHSNCCIDVAFPQAKLQLLPLLFLTSLSRRQFIIFSRSTESSDAAFLAFYDFAIAEPSEMKKRGEKITFIKDERDESF